jgi:hypothetical protein
MPLSLFSVFLLAFLLRTWDLGSNPPGLYNDELYLLLSAFSQIHNTSVITTMGYNVNELLFYFIDGYVPAIYVFGPTDFAARLSPAFYGSVIVFPVYLIANLFFRRKSIALTSAILWAVSPSAVMTSRVGYGVELFPLFLFLIFFYFAYEFYLSHNYLYLLLSGLILVPLLFFSYSILVWVGFPLAAFLVFLSLVTTFNRFTFPIKTEASGIIRNVIAGLLTISVVWFVIYFLYISNFKIDGITIKQVLPTQNPIFLMPLTRALYLLFVRFGFAVNFFKLFWLDEFTATQLYYQSPVLVPFMFSFEIPFFYGSFIYFALYRKELNANKNAISLTLLLFFFGLFQPILNTSNPSNYFEPSEGIFSLPFASIMVSLALYETYERLGRRALTFRRSIGENLHKFKRIVFGTIAKNNVQKIFVASLFIFSSINVTTFSYDLYHELPGYMEGPNGGYYPFYGWQQTANFIDSHGLASYQLYYVPGSGGSYNFTNTSNLNYWYYHQHFPLYWLYTFSDGQITSTSLLSDSSLPPFGSHGTVILSQDIGYTETLSATNTSYRVLYTVFMQNGTPAIQVIEIPPPTLTVEQESQLRLSNLFHIFDSNTNEVLLVQSLGNIRNQLSVSVNFSMPNTSINTAFTLIQTQTPTFALGVWPSSDLGNLTSRANDTFWGAGDIYTSWGNYSSHNTWQRLWAPHPLMSGTEYLLTLTYNNGSMKFYLNNNLYGEFHFNYTLYPPGKYVVIDPSTNVWISYAAIWDVSLSEQELSFVYYNGINSITE